MKVLVVMIALSLSVSACSTGKDEANAMRAFVGSCKSKVSAELTLGDIGSGIRMSCSDMAGDSK